MPSPQWESYFWPGTQVLQNKLGLKDEAALTVMERLHTTLQAERIAAGLIPIDQTFDAAHIKAIHAALFSWIYTWAGEFRTVNMRRGVNEFASVADIPGVVDEMHRQISETDWGIDDRAEEGLNLAEAIGDGFVARQCRTWLGNTHMLRGDLAAAAAELRKVVAEAEAAHDRIAEVLASIVLGYVLAYQGDTSAARAAADAALEVSAALGGFNGDAAHATLAIAALAAGDVSTAADASEAAWRVRVARREALLMSIAPMALAALARGDLAASRQWADDTVSKTTGWHLMVALAERVRVAIAQGEPEQAERDAHDALAIGTEIRSVLVTPDVLECLAELAGEANSHREAARLFGAAKAIRQRIGVVRFQIYQAGYESSLAAVRNTLGDDEFEAAWTEGAALSADEAIGYARRGRGERKRPTSGWASLTPTERDVVRLVTEGLANKDIAARLFVSPRTVQTHLTHVYTKLGLTSRLQLVQEASRHT